jgi:hypothetical protein
MYRRVDSFDNQRIHTGFIRSHPDGSRSPHNRSSIEIREGEGMIKAILSIAVFFAQIRSLRVWRMG